MWLEFQIDFLDLATVIFFELKVLKETTIESLRNFVAELLNIILQSENFPNRYDRQHIMLQRIKMSNEVIIATDLRSSMVRQATKARKIRETVDSDQVKTLFDYINRYVLCIPPSSKHFQNNKQRRLSVTENLCQSICTTLANIKLQFQIRNHKAERKLGSSYRQSSVSSKRVSLIEENKSQVCACSII